ncbi:MAG: ADP-ribosylglycohydrolase family protein [Candidatus Geothermincolia bacterium]
METRERYRGSLLGLAAGDALGAPVQFLAPRTFAPLARMVGGGHFGLEPGQWTDDTSMALCLADSLIERRGFDPLDQMRRYLRWLREGYLTSTGYSFDIGGTVAGSLERFEATGEHFAGPTHPHSAGNGSLMRLAPVPLAGARHPARAIEMAAESSRTTHGATACLDACRYMAGLIVGALAGATKEELLSARFSPIAGYYDEEPLCPEIDAVAAGSFKHKDPPELRGTGYVVDCLEAALWAFFRNDGFERGCLAAVNLGDDADTTGAVFGQLAGAYYGAGSIPAPWLQVLSCRPTIERMADRLLALSESV